MMKLKQFILSLLAVLTMLPTAAADFNIIHGPYLQNVGENEATIVWITDKPSVGWVELAPADSSVFYAEARPKVFDTSIGIKNTTRVHAVRLTGLRPGTFYRYRVCSQEVLSHNYNKVMYGDLTCDYRNGDLRFKTNDASKPSVSFAMVNDIHGRNSVLEKMIRQCDLKSTDLFLFNGDMVSFMNSEAQTFAGFMDKADTLFAGSIPMYYCRGNHETRGQFASEFKKYFNPFSDELFYMFRQGPVCFVVLDCGEDKPDSDIAYYGLTDYDGYRSKQAEWLRTALKSDLYRNAPFKVIVCHMPPFDGWHGTIDVRNKFLPLLNDARPDIYLCGHLHQYIRHEAGQDGIGFPLIVNSNNTLLKAEATEHSMDIRIFSVDGRQTDRLVLRK